MIRADHLLLSCVLGALLVAAGCASTREGPGHDTPGLNYELHELKDPRPNRVHVLRVNLADRTIHAAVIIAPDPDGTGPAEAALTHPLKLAASRSILAFVNSNPWDSFPDTGGSRNRSWFEGQPVDIQGLAASGGHVRSPAQPDTASVWIDARGRAFMGDGAEDRSVVEGMAGFQQIVKEGAVTVSPGGALHPRTAIGAGPNGNVMWLVVVDGRQKRHSEGMSVYELGRFMLDLGCSNAVNMDGGGSSIMGLMDAAGRLRIVNSPSDRLLGVTRIRPLPMILTIQETSHNTSSPIVDKEPTER